MRSVALFIILLNLLVFAWYQRFLPWLPWQPPEKIAYQPVPETKEIPKLILLSEKDSNPDIFFDDTVAEGIFSDTDNAIVDAPKFELVSTESTTTDTLANTTAVTVTDNEENSADPKPITEIAYTLSELGRIAEQEVKKTSKQLAQQFQQPVSDHFLADEGFSLKSTEATSPVTLNQATTALASDIKTKPNSPAPHASSSQTDKAHDLSPIEKKTATVKALSAIEHKEEVKKPLHIATSSTILAENKNLKQDSPANKQHHVSDKNKGDKEVIAQTKPVLTKKTQTKPISPPQPHFICYTTGIYQDKSLAQRVTTWFNSKATTRAKINIKTSRKLVSTWVYLPPLKNRAEARRKEYELDNLGITTHHIIAKGAYQNALSLGRFKSQKNVTNFLHWLQSRGLNGVKTKNNYHKNETYTVHVKLEKMASQHVVKTFKRRFKHQIHQQSRCK